MGDHEMGNAMGVNTWAAFAGSDAQAVVDGDFAMYESELQGVLKALRHAGINIVAIHNHMTGEIPRVMFLHFWGGSSREWSSVIDGLSPRFHCVALDARGSGASDAPTSGYGIADLADDVEGVIAALKLKSYVLVGHSMGGKTAQLLASRRPQGLRGLALVASSPPTPMATSE